MQMVCEIMRRGKIIKLWIGLKENVDVNVEMMYV